MAISDLYMIAPPFLQSLFDKDTALLMANGTISFYKDSDRLTPKPVYELGGYPNYSYTQLPNPVTLNGSGQPLNASNVPTTVYLNPYDDQGNVELYYVVIENSATTEQITLEAWPNLDDNEAARTENLTSVDNQISNPQFTEVYINEGINTEYTVTGSEQTFAFAPDWDFVIDGTGTVTVSRTAVAGSSDTSTNPPYFITVQTSSGISKCWLRQRMRVNSGLWSSNTDSNIYLAGGVLAQGVGSPQNVAMYYLASSGGASQEILLDSAPTADLTFLKSTSDVIPSSSDTNTGEDGYVDIYLSFNASQTVNLSSVQVIPTYTEDGGDALEFKSNTSNRHNVYLSDFYNLALSARTQGNLLTGWDFPVNPRQFGTSGTMPAAPDYFMDQTIGFATSGSAAWAQTSSGGLQITSSGANDRILIAQYLSGADVKRLIGNKLCMNIQAYKGSVGNDVTLRAYLCRGTAGASFPTLTSFIGSMGSNAAFTVTAANWTAIDRSGLGDATATLPVITTNVGLNEDYDIRFSQWQLTDGAQIGDTDKFCVVITCLVPTTATVLRFFSVNVSTGDIPSRPVPESASEVLRKCQYYYEKSYNLDVSPGTIDNTGLITRPQLAFSSPDGVSWRPGNFEYQFKQEKITTPTITYYDPEASSVTATGRYYFYSGFSRTGAMTQNTGTVAMTGGLWSYDVSTSNVFAELAAFTTSFAAPSINYGTGAWLNFHYVADARLGK